MVVSSGTMRRPDPRALDTAQMWGPAPELRAAELNRHARELKSELMGLASDVRRGPLEAYLTDATAYLGELRREFLRTHRRLLVHTRDEDRDHVPDLLRTELAELSERLRAAVLARSSRISKEGWRPRRLVRALERTIEVLPEHVDAAYEARTTLQNRTEPWRLRIGRLLTRVSLRLRAVGGDAPTRTVELQDLARFHLPGMAVDQLEGVAALFVQADTQLVGHTRMILDGIDHGFETLRGHVRDPNLSEVLDSFRSQVEEEFQLAEAELVRLVDDGGRRVTRILADGFRALKEDLPIAGTFELPNRKRRTERMGGQEIALADLDRRLDAVRGSVASSYMLLGLHLEHAAFRARVRVVLARHLDELRKDVRGRSHTQIERVLATVDEVLEGLSQGDDADETMSLEDDSDVAGLLEPLERVLTEALRAANQLLEQLTEEQLVAPLLEGLNREAQSLTDRYVVPAGRVPHAEWRLPAPLAQVEVGFAELVSAYVQTDIAPELLRVTHGALEALRPMVAALHDLERVVTIDTDQLGVDLDLSREEAPGGVREVARAALSRSQESLQVVLQRLDGWSEDLAEALKMAVLSQVDRQRSRLSEGTIGRLERGRGRAVAAPALSQQVDRIAALFDRVGEEATRQVRRLVGERRLLDWRVRLGLPDPVVSEAEAVDLLAPPTQPKEVPLFYRRLFTANAYWAGDLLPAQRAAVERTKAVLTRAPQLGLRTAAILSADGAGQGALLTAITRGERFSQVRRITFSRPVSEAEAEDIFFELGQGQLMVVGGFRWLFGAKPGGFAPLRAFLAGIIADGGHNAWLLEASDLSWAYGRSVAPLDDVFSEVVRVGALDREELERALMSRHQLSGLEARFAAEGEAEAGEGVARERFFAALHAYAGGYLVRALPAWTASVARVDEDERWVRFVPPPPNPLPALQKLPDETLVLLLAVLRQGWMDADTAAVLFRWSPLTAAGRLGRLVSDGLLERKGSTLFQLRRHLRPGLRQVLQKRGWCP